MKVLVVNGSPKGENSVTLQTVYYLQTKYKESAEFLYLHAGQRIHSLEKDFQAAEELLKGADLILFSYPILCLYSVGSMLVIRQCLSIISMGGVPDSWKVRSNV